MADVEISYNDDTIVSMSDSGTEYLDTKGKFMADNITVQYNRPTTTLVSKSVTANGTYNASSDNADGYSSVTVNVSGGGTTHVFCSVMQGSMYIYQTPSGTVTIVTVDPTILAIDVDALAGSMVIWLSPSPAQPGTSITNATLIDEISLGSRASYRYALIFQVN